MVRKSTLKPSEIGPRGSARAPKVVWSAKPPKTPADTCICQACGGSGTVLAPLDLAR